jgi:hypothetical protein
MPVTASDFKIYHNAILSHREQKKSVLPKVRRKLGAGSKLSEKDQRLVLEVSERLGKE